MNRSLIPLAGLYSTGARLRRRAFQRGWLKSRRLSHPVISVGNLTVGGSGKTPLVAEVAAILLRNGYKPSILTRGYGRKRGAELIALEPQSQRNPDSRAVGDEPALLARALPQVPVIICADRYRAGQVAEEHFGVDIHILDDGFQHFALQRDLDLVAIDVTQGVLQDSVLPGGRLREPLSALSRADVLVLTRVEIQDPASTEAQVRKRHPDTPIFRCSMGLRSLVKASTHEIIEPQNFRRTAVCAFCAIGNPSAFFSDLSRWGFNTVAEIALRDHHVYSKADIHRLNQKARDNKAAVFLTTEKDLMNLPAGLEFELPVMACAIRAEILDSQRFEQVLLAGFERKQVGSKVVR